MAIGKILREILAKHTLILAKHTPISAKEQFSYQQDPILHTFITLVIRIFASEYLNNTDNDFTPILFPTYVCLRFLGCTNRMHLIL